MKLKVQGPLDNPKKSAKGLIGKPINDKNGNRIGFVSAVDDKNWYGIIRCEIDQSRYIVDRSESEYYWKERHA